MSSCALILLVIISFTTHCRPMQRYTKIRVMPAHVQLCSWNAHSSLCCKAQGSAIPTNYISIFVNIWFILKHEGLCARNHGDNCLPSTHQLYSGVLFKLHWEGDQQSVTDRCLGLLLMLLMKLNERSIALHEARHWGNYWNIITEIAFWHLNQIHHLNPTTFRKACKRGTKDTTDTTN